MYMKVSFQQLVNYLCFQDTYTKCTSKVLMSLLEKISREFNQSKRHVAVGKENGTSSLATEDLSPLELMMKKVAQEAAAKING